MRAQKVLQLSLFNKHLTRASSAFVFNRHSLAFIYVKTHEFFAGFKNVIKRT